MSSSSKPRDNAFNLRRLAITAAVLTVGLYLYWDASLEGEYRGNVTDAVSGRGILVLSNGNALIRTIDGEEIAYGTYTRVNRKWKLTTIGGNSEWRVDRGLWGFTLITATNEVERFRRRLPFEKVHVQFPE